MMAFTFPVSPLPLHVLSLQGHSLSHESIPTQSHGCSLSPAHEARQKAKIGASLSASAKVTCLSVKSRQTWMALGRQVRCRGVQSGSLKAWYCPNHCPTAQIPSWGVKLRTPFLLTDSRATPTAHQSPASATSTSQQCLPAAKPWLPSTQGSVSKRSGLLGSNVHSSPRPTPRWSLATMRKGLAVSGSRVTRVTSAGDRGGEAAQNRQPQGCTHPSKRRDRVSSFSLQQETPTTQTVPGSLLPQSCPCPRGLHSSCPRGPQFPGGGGT